MPLPLRWLAALAVPLLAACQSPPEATPCDGNSSRSVVRFGLVADIQYAAKAPAGSRRYDESPRKLAACVADWNGESLDFTVQLGDLIDGRETPEATRADLEAILAVLGQSRAPGHHVLGNHDLTLPREEILGRLGMDPAYTTFATGGWRFIVLDSLDVSLCGCSPESPRYREAKAWLDSHPPSAHPNAHPWNGGLGRDQLDWLKATLTDAGARGEKVIIFSHLPLLAAAGHPSTVAWEAARVRALLEDSGCVVACFAGHDHAGGQARSHGIHYVTLKGLVEAPPQGNAYATVQLDDTSIKIHGRGSVESRTLRLRAAGHPR